MPRAKPPDDEPNRKGGFLSWRGAMASWLIISIVGWIVIAALVAVLTPDQEGTIATDKDAKGLEDVAPAAGPRPKPDK
jgi:uncharacterized membrane protein YdfJ with MMPL/SSD domain